MVLNFITLLVVALSGLGILFYAFLQKRKKKGQDLPQDPEKDDPILHIRNKLFFEIPVEKILLGYFVIVTLTYLVKFILNLRVPGIDLAILYLSGLTLFLGIYKMAMSVGVVNKFSPWLLFSMIFSLIIFIAVYTGMPMGINEFLEETRQYNLAIHLLGLSMGLGGTLVVDIMFTHFMRNYAISSRESVIMHLISQMIIFGIFLLILSGVALYLPAAESFNENPRFIMKMIVVLIVIINGGILNLYLTPKMNKISLVDDEKHRYVTLTRISFALGAISIVSWLSAFLLALLKDLFTMPLLYLMIGYLVLLLLAAGGSQMAKVYYEKQEEEENE